MVHDLHGRLSSLHFVGFTLGLVVDYDPQLWETQGVGLCLGRFSEDIVGNDYGRDTFVL